MVRRRDTANWERRGRLTTNAYDNMPSDTTANDDTGERIERRQQLSIDGSDLSMDVTDALDALAHSFQKLDGIGDDIADTVEDAADAVEGGCGCQLCRGEMERDDIGKSAGEDDLTEIAGVGMSKADALRDAGYQTIDDIRDARQEELAAVDGVGMALAARIMADVGGIGDDEPTFSVPSGSWSSGLTRDDAPEPSPNWHWSTGTDSTRVDPTDDTDDYAGYAPEPSDTESESVMIPTVWTGDDMRDMERDGSEAAVTLPGHGDDNADAARLLCGQCSEPVRPVRGNAGFVCGCEEPPSGYTAERDDPDKLSEM